MGFSAFAARLAAVSGLAVALTAFSCVASAEAMTFRLVTLDSGRCGANCPKVISAEGEIGDETPDAFADFIRKNVKDRSVKNVMFLHSPGGRVVSALRLGYVLRKFGTAVVVARVRDGTSADANGQFGSARCMSACAYVLAGGKSRVVPPLSQVGIHRMFREEYGKDPANETSGYRQTFASGSMVEILSRYAGAMGISREMITEAEKISPGDIHIVTPNELARWRLGRPKL